MTTMGSTNWFTCGAMAKMTPLEGEGEEAGAGERRRWALL
jgi:hypothetical protein